jgi:hypothetical protein
MDLIIAVMAGLAAFLIGVAALLRGWSSWLELKRAQLDGGGGSARRRAFARAADRTGGAQGAGPPLEAIANGVEG